jgi:TPR repeat protein
MDRDVEEAMGHLAGGRAAELLASLQRAFDNHVGRAAFLLGMFAQWGCFVPESVGAARELQRCAAEWGYAPGMAKLACHRNNEEQVLSWCDGMQSAVRRTHSLRRAAKAAESQDCLARAILAESGVGMARDQGAATALYREAALGGDPVAQYLMGLRVTDDESFWLTCAATAGT